MRFSSFIAFLFFGFLFLGETIAQQHPILKNFEGYLAGDEILLNWVIKSGSTCSGIQIYRSSNGVAYEQVGEIVGVCGDVGTETSYTFTDTAPVVNSTNIYKLTLGTQGFSTPIEVVYVLLNSENYNLFPNPADDKASIHFANAGFEKGTFSVYALSGRKVLEMLDVEQQSLSFSTVNFEQGIYVFYLQLGSEVIRGELVVKRS